MAYDLDYIREQQRRQNAQNAQTPAPPQAPPATPSAAPPPTSTAGPAAPPQQYTPPGAPAQPYNAGLSDDENFFNSLFAPGNISNQQWDAQRGAMEARGWKILGADKVQLPSGDIIDVRGNVNDQTGGENSWINLTRNTGSGDRPFATAGGAGGVGAGASGNGSGLSDFQQKTRAMIMEQLGKLGQPVTADDPTIKAQMDAARVQSDRSLGDQQKAMAERLYGEGQGAGVGNGQLMQGIQTSRERVGAQLAGQQGQLMSSELQSRRGSLQNLLALATQTGDAESSRALQLQIAQMDDAIRRQTLAEQGRQFDDDLGYRVGRASEDDRRYRTNLATGGDAGGN